MTEHEIKKMETVISIPEGVAVTVSDGSVNVKGPKGEMTRKFTDKFLRMASEGNTLKLSYKKMGQKEKKKMFTAAAHIKNMLKGANESYVYKLKICTGHFPMAVSVKGDVLEIKNFIGEKVPRTLKLKNGAKVEVSGEIITVESSNKEISGQVAADIEKMTRRPGFDKRIFQDGIYIMEKHGKKM